MNWFSICPGKLLTFIAQVNETHIQFYGGSKITIMLIYYFKALLVLSI